MSKQQEQYGVNLTEQEIAEIRSFISRRQNHDKHTDTDVIGRIHQKLGNALDQDPEPHWDTEGIVKRFDKMLTIFSNEYYSSDDKTESEDEVLQAIHREVDNWKKEMGFPTPTIGDEK